MGYLPLFNIFIFSFLGVILYFIIGVSCKPIIDAIFKNMDFDLRLGIQNFIPTIFLYTCSSLSLVAYIASHIYTRETTMPITMKRYILAFSSFIKKYLALVVILMILPITLIQIPNTLIINWATYKFIFKPNNIVMINLGLQLCMILIQIISIKMLFAKIKENFNDNQIEHLVEIDIIAIILYTILYLLPFSREYSFYVWVLAILPIYFLSVFTRYTVVTHTASSSIKHSHEDVQQYENPKINTDIHTNINVKAGPYNYNTPSNNINTEYSPGYRPSTSTNINTNINTNTNTTVSPNSIIIKDNVRYAPCPRCKKYIPLSSWSCPSCGIVFRTK